MFKKLVLPLTAIGMLTLAMGCALALSFEILGRDIAQGYLPQWKTMPPAYVAANALWILGAVILIVPPAIEGFFLLLVLEMFSVISGLLSYWIPTDSLGLTLKIIVRIALSLTALALVKRRGYLGSSFIFPWSLLDPRFYIAAMREGGIGALVVGLECLGFGYALNWSFFFTVGSLYLVRGAWVNWRKDRQPLFACWAALNALYSVTGIVILIARWLRSAP